MVDFIPYSLFNFIYNQENKKQELSSVDNFWF